MINNNMLMYEIFLRNKNQLVDLLYKFITEIIIQIIIIDFCI